jgi:hypothetical protein
MMLIDNALGSIGLPAVLDPIMRRTFAASRVRSCLHDSVPAGQSRDGAGLEGEFVAPDGRVDVHRTSIPESSPHTRDSRETAEPARSVAP